MDWEDDQIDCSSVDQFVWENNVLKKSSSETSLIHKSGSCETQFEYQESKNLTLSFEKLQIEREINSSEEKRTTPRSQETQTCTCAECIKEDCKTLIIKSRELSSLKLFIHGPDILNHHGEKHSQEEVAAYFKKDSRTWLWKSLKNTKKQKNDSPIFSDLEEC